MKVKIKKFAVELDVKSKGIEFQVHDNSGKFLGDCYVTMTGIEWCSGKTTQGKGKKVMWEKFIADMTK